MKKKLEEIFLFLLLLIGSVIYTGLNNGGLKVFITLLMFLLFSSVLLRVILNKKNRIPYKAMLGSPIALIVSLLFYILLNDANNSLSQNDFFIFSLKAVQISFLIFISGLVLFLFSFLKKKLNKQVDDIKGSD